VTPRVLCVGGLDPSGGAGLIADAEAVRAAGGRPGVVCAALTAQGPGGALGVQPVAADFLDAQIRAVGVVDGFKTGMLGTAAVVELIAQQVEDGTLPRPVVDPVVRASSGLELLDASGRDALRRTLLPCAAVVTPNLDEAAWLTGRDVRDVAGMEDAARALLDRGCGAAVITGGHLDGALVDVLATGADVMRLARVRVPGTARGTGCRFAAFLATRLAAGDVMAAAAVAAGLFVAAHVTDVSVS